MAQLLTRRKQAWVDRRRPDVVVGLSLNPNVSIEARYYARLERLIDRMTAEAEKDLTRLFKGEAAEEYFAQDESVASQARKLTNALLRKFEDLFNAASKPIAEQFAGASDRASSAAVHSSVQQLTGGLSLPTSAITAPMKEVLKATISENVSLIRSIPQQYLAGVQGAVMRSITTGNGLQDLVPYLKKHKDITIRRARMIANDQTRKAFNNLNKGRMLKVGLKKYRWLHTAGSKEPRKLHKDVLNGQIFSFDDPPVIDDNTGERGIPGQAINCRCRMVPVLDFEGDDNGSTEKTEG